MSWTETVLLYLAKVAGLTLPAAFAESLVLVSRASGEGGGGRIAGQVTSVSRWSYQRRVSSSLAAVRIAPRERHAACAPRGRQRLNTTFLGAI
jgi:hypothetical protein